MRVSPCISTGVYGYPNRAATRVALDVVKSWVKEYPEKMDRIVFCVFLDKDHSIFTEELPTFFDGQTFTA